MTRSLLFQQVLNGLAIGSVCAIFTLGAYATYALTGASFGFNGLLANASLPVRLPFVLALIGGSLFAAVCGVIVERLAFRPLRARGSDPLLTLVSSLGVAVALVNVIQYLFGAEAYSYPADPFGHLPSAVNFGTAAQPILVRTVQVIIFGGLSVGIAGPYFGIAFGLKGLAVIVLGGLGDIPGAVVGGLVIGLVEAFVPSQYIAYREAVPFALLFVVLLLRPQGLLGRTIVQKV